MRLVECGGGELDLMPDLILAQSLLPTPPLEVTQGLQLGQSVQVGRLLKLVS